jgi:hypothetical protein
MRKLVPALLVVSSLVALCIPPTVSAASVSAPQLNGLHYGGVVVVYMVTATAGAGIRYTTDGTDPTANSPVYNPASPPALYASATVKARAFKSGMLPSSVTARAYTVYTVTKVEIVKEHSPLDNNPNAGGGLRIFADRNYSSDSNFRDSVIVTATISPPVPFLQVDFRVFDPDDPNTNATIDPNGPAGNDNLPDLTFRPLKGTLSGGGARTDSLGRASVRLTVGWQPGNNYVVAATTDSFYANGLRLRASNGSVIEDSAGLALPNARAKLTPMLTVWRRLHVEVDRMANVAGNTVEGVVAGVTNSAAGTSTLDLGLNLPAPGATGTDGLRNRFEGGTLSITAGGITTAYPVVSNTANASGNDKVTVRGTVSAAAVGQRYKLVDDDHAHGFGDGAVVPLPDTGRLAACFAPAYILPVFDLSNPQPVVPFVLNAAGSAAGDLLPLYRFDNIRTENFQTYWTVYVLGAMQGPVGEDGDPDDVNLDGRPDEPGGYSLGTVDAVGGGGAIIYLEGVNELAGGKRVLTNVRGTGEQDVVAHMVGHLFGAEHFDGGLMAQQSNVFGPESLRKIRQALHP